MKFFYRYLNEARHVHVDQVVNCIAQFTSRVEWLLPRVPEAAWKRQTVPTNVAGIRRIQVVLKSLLHNALRGAAIVMRQAHHLVDPSFNIINYHKLK